MITILLRILQIVAPVIVFFYTKKTLYDIFDKIEIPPYLNFKPYNCLKCFQFWFLLSLSLSLMYILEIYVSPSILLVLAILDAIAMHINENKYVN